MFKKIIVISLIAFSILNLKAQEVAIPPSPNAAAFTSYAETPVSKYTGIPNISIPIFDIKLSKFDLPITLSYYASGIKVDQEASWVGLGWNLNLGGCITRQVRGLDDFGEIINSTEYEGYSELTDPIPTYESSDESSMKYITIDSQGTPKLMKDGEPDIYFFNFGKYTGKFMFDEEGNPTPLNPEVGLDIIKMDKFQWKIKDSNGILYNFNIYETTKQTSETSSSKADLEPWPQNNSKEYVTAWYLSQILLPNGESIDFGYSINDFGDKSIVRQSHEKKEDLARITILPESDDCSLSIWDKFYRIIFSFLGSLLPDQEFLCDVANPCQNYAIFNHDSYTNSATVISRQAILKSVTWPTGHIELITGGRNDIKRDFGTSEKLDSIKIYNSNNTLIKGYKFIYSNFNNNLANRSDKEYYLRLKLDGLKQISSTNALPPYEFEYYYDPDFGHYEMPIKNSPSSDYWGYYNGQSNLDENSDPEYIPTYICPTVYEPDLDIPNLNIDSWQIVNGTGELPHGVYYPGADKKCYPKYINTGSLKAIRYPTGGTTTFNYSANSYCNNLNEYGYSIQQPIIVSACKLLDGICSQDAPESDQEFFDINAKQEVSLDYSYGNYSLFTWDEFGPKPTSMVIKIDKVNQNNSIISNVKTIYYDFPSEVDMTYTPLYYQKRGEKVLLDEGRYRLYVEPVDNFQAEAKITYIELTENSLSEEFGGGIRIQKIQSDDKTRYFDYSCGKLLSKPDFPYFVGSAGSCTEGYYFLLVSLVRGSYSVSPLTDFKTGSAIGYDQVKESIINSKGEKSVIEQNFYNMPEQATIPFFPNVENNLNGYKLSEKYYKGDDNNPIYEKYYEPEIDQASSKSINAYGFIKNRGGFYSNKVEWVKTNYVEEKYWNTNSIISNKTEYIYNPLNFQIQTKITTTADGNIITDNFSYVVDYAGNINSKYYDMATNKHLLDLIVEKYHTINDIFTTATFFSYKNENGIYVPEKINNLELIQPTSNFSPFNGTSIDPSYGSPETNFEKYDNLGNLIQWKNRNSNSESVIWGYNEEYPVAFINNSTIDKVAYTSFESIDDLGGWEWSGGGTVLKDISAKTGDCVFQMGGANSLHKFLTSGSYYIEYWAKDDVIVSGAFNVAESAPDNNGWIYYKKRIDILSDSEISLTGSTSIDELRLYPINAQMTSYTFCPMVGITSKNDPNGIIYYYKYDDFGRLINIKDNYENILNNFNYNYFLGSSN